MVDVLKRLYEPKYMVKKELQLGDMPTAKEGYSRAFSTASAAIAETFLIALIGMADTAMVGTIGTDAIAAVGATTQPRFLVQTLVISLNIAVTSICARRYGERNRDGAVGCLKQGLILSTIFSVILMFIAVPLAIPLLSIMGTDADIVGMSHDYLVIMLIGMPLSSISLTISSALRGIGKTRESMVINMSANIVNIGFNYVLINGIGPFPKLEVRGAAIASVIGFGVGLIIAIIIVANPNNYLFIFEKNGWKLHKETLKSMFKVASGSFIEQICVRAGFMMYGRIVMGLGKTLFAAHQIFMNLLSLSFSFGEGFGISSASLVGQNLGAGRPDLSIAYGKICQRMSLISSAFMFLVFTFGRNFLVNIFTDDPIVHSESVAIFYVMALIVFAQASQMVFMGSLRGAGDTKYTAVISLICILVVRSGLGYIMAYPMGLGLLGVWIGLVGDQFLRLILTYQRFSSGNWTKVKL